jgi:hypothetical protein
MIRFLADASLNHAIVSGCLRREAPGESRPLRLKDTAKIDRAHYADTLERFQAQ